MAIKARAQQNLTKVFDGSGVFSIILTNENTSIPISSQGLALNYSGTSSDIYVYSGTSILTPVASNPNAGEYTLTAAGENITPGLVTQNTDHASIAVASGFVTGESSYSVTFTASGKDFLGNPFTAQKKQVITPLRHGDDATSYWVNTTSSVVMKDVNDNLQPSTVTVSAVSQEGFANAAPYGAIFKVYVRTGADFPSTPNYTSSAPETSHAVSLDTTINDIRIDMYSADGVNLLDTQTVPIIAQANGVINTKIQYTVTDTSVQPTDSNSWSDTVPTVGIGQFLWTKTTFYYTDGSNAVAYSMGHVGKDGASAPLLVLSSDSQAFTFDGDNNPSPANQTINLVAVLQNLTGTATFVATPYLNGAAGTPISLGGTGNARTLNVSQFGQVYDSVVIKASLGNLSDTETIHKLSDGSNGTPGSQGVPGAPGADGVSSYVHIAYANSADGSLAFSTTDPTGRGYIGVLTDNSVPDSTDYTRYTWSLVKGIDGAQGPTGPTGATGPKGTDGLSTYVHVAYANSSDGSTGFSTTDPTGRGYIGVLTDNSVPDSTDYTKYTWSLVKGTDGANGAQGIPGPAGIDGVSTYIHFAYATNDTGSTGFSTTDPAGKTYIGVYTDSAVPDSTDPTKYTWSLIQGPTGSQGPQGIPGPTGPNGVSTYVHFAYANSSDGTVGFSTTANNQTYIGVYTDNTQSGSTDPTKYTWSLMKGADGKNAITGWLTNESITLQADSNGNVPSYTSATGSFVVYNGTTQVTGLTVNQANAVGMTLSISGMNYSVTNMVADIAYVDMSVTYSGTTITKRLTLAKSKAGANGSNGTSVVNSTTPPANPTQGQWWNDTSVTPNILKVYQSGNWVPYRIDAINLVAQSVTTDKLAANVLVASNVTFTNKNGTTTNLQTFNFDGIQTLLSDGNGNVYSSMDNAVSSTQSFQSFSNKLNNLQVGGRNLVLGTATDTTWMADPASNYSFNVIATGLKPNQTYTFSAEVTLGNTDQKITTVSLFNEPIGQYLTSTDNFKADGTRDHWTFTVPTTVNTPTASLIIYAGTTGSTGGKSVTYHHIKLETGNLPTDWSPAPEDTDSQFSAVQSNITQTANQIKANLGSANLFPNSEFEKDYGYRDKNGNTSLSLDHKDNVDGRYNGTVQVISTDSTWQGYWTRNIPVYGGQKYSMSVLVHYTNGGLSNSYAALDVWFVDKDGNRISGGEGGNSSNTTGQVGSPWWVKLYLEGVTAPKNAAYVQVSLIVSNAGAGQTAIFTQPMVTATEKLQPYAVNNDITTGLQLMTDNYTLGVSSDGKLVSGVTGNAQEVTLKGNVIKLDADTVIGSNFILQSANIGDLTAGKIKTGSISGPSLSINLDTGSVLFQKGRIYSQGKEIDLNIDQKYIRSYGQFGVVSLENGALYLSGPVYDKPIITDGPSIDLYLSVSSVLMPSLAGQPDGYIGASFLAKDFMQIGLSDFPIGEWIPGQTSNNLGTIISRQTGTSVYGKDIGVNIAGGSVLNNPGGISFKTPRIAVGFNPTKDPTSMSTNPGDDLRSGGILLSADSVVLSDAGGTHGSITRDGVKTDNYTRYVTSQNSTQNLPLVMGLERIGNLVMVSFNFTTYGSVIRADQVVMDGPKIPVGFRPLDNVHIQAHANNSGTTIGTITFTIRPDGAVLQTSPAISGVFRLMGSGLYMTYSISPTVGSKVSGSTGDTAS